MQFDNLIDELASDVPALPRSAMTQRLAIGTGVGAVIALGLLLAFLGVRPDFVEASATMAFWMKWAFTVSLAWAAFALLKRLGQPDEGGGAIWWALAAPIALVVMMGAGELILVAPSSRATVWLGHSAARCLVTILLLSAPVFLGLVWSFRRLAPTRLHLAGFAVGMLSGATSATVYALSCSEGTPAFLATWYVLGILAAGMVGAVAGPRLLRW